MARTFPTDVAVFGPTSLLHARFERGKKSPRILGAKSYSLPEGTFGRGLVTPLAENREAIASVIRRMKLESGRIDRLSVLLPDSWFRINLLNMESLPDSRKEADEIVRWQLKRTMPIRAEEFRIAHQTVGRSNGHLQVLVLAAYEKALASIESVFQEQQTELVLIEPTGLNVWNAIVTREAVTNEDRVFLYLRERDFTTAVFRGPTPLFIRARNLTGERSLVQEVKLSASYFRNTVQTEKIAVCYIAASAIDEATAQSLADEFSSPARRVQLSSYADAAPSVDSTGITAELTACTGVFAA
jgi:hypothetical protein